MTGRRITGWGVVALAAATAVLAGIVVLAVDVGTVHASPSVDTSRFDAKTSSLTHPGIALAASTGSIAVTSDRPLPARFDGMSPGMTERWRVTATVSSTADLTLGLDRSGVLASRPDGLALAVAECATAWSVEGSCPGTSSVVVPSTSLSAAFFSDDLPVARVPSGSSTHLLLSFTLPDSEAARSDRSLMGQTATVVVTVSASGGTRPGTGANGGVRPGQGGSGSVQGGAGQGGAGPGGTGSSAGGGAAGSDGSAQSPAGGPGSGLLAWTGSWAALPGGVGLGLVLGGAFLLVRRRHARSSRESSER